MKSFTITITGDCPDTVSDALILRAAYEAAVPLHQPDPEWGRGIPGQEWMVTNVTTIATHDNIVAPENLDPKDPINYPKVALKLAREFPDQKIQAIKEMRAQSNLGLKDAKDYIDDAFMKIQASTIVVNVAP